MRRNQEKKYLRYMGAAAVLLMCGVGAFNGTTAEAKEGKTKNYEYSIEKNGKVSILKYIGKKKKVTVPKKIKGKVVNTLFFGAFSETKVTNVTLPDSVKTIEMSAFADCKKLKKVTMPGVNVIEAFSFENCPNLKEVVIPKNIKTIDGEAFKDCKNLISVGDITVDHVEYGAFENCGKLASKITLSEKCTHVGSYAFYGCTNVELTIPNTIKQADAFAFAFCQKLTKITIPNNVDWIGFRQYEVPDPDFEPDSLYLTTLKCNVNMNVYAGCTNIKEIDLQDTSGKLVLENGVLYNKDKTLVVYVLPTYEGNMEFLSKVKYLSDYALTGFKQENLVFPTNLEKIGEGVLFGAKTKHVQWPASATSVPYNAFAYSDITELELPEGVKEIRDKAISFCKNLKTVTLPKSFQTFSYDDEWSSLFRGLPALEKIKVAKGNKKYYSKQGILFKKESKNSTLVCYPAAKKGKTYTVPKNVYLGIYCFDSLQYLRKVIIPKNSVEKSVWNYFIDCKNVTVSLPKTMKYVASEEHSTDFPLFKNCKNCKALVKKGSKVLKYFKKYAKWNPDMWAYKVVK